MPEAKKEIVFTAKTDASWARLKEELRDVTQAMAKLVQTAQGLNQAMGRGSGPIAVGGGGPATTGGIGAAQRNQTQAQGGGGFAQAFVDASRQMKGMADVSKGAMQAMTDAMRRGIGEQQSTVARLAKELDGLGQMYERVGGKASGAFGNKVQGLIAGKIGELKEAQKELSDMVSAGSGPGGGPRDDIAMPGQKGGIFSRFRGFLNQGGGMGGQEVSMANISKVPGLGFMGNMGGAAGGMMFAAAGAAAALGVKAAMSQANAAWNNQIISAQSRVETTNLGPSNYARKLRGGDLSDLRSMQDIQNDSDKRREFQEIQDPGWIRRQGNRWSAFSDAFGKRGFKEGFSSLFEGTSSTDYQNILKRQLQEKVDVTTQERGVMEDIYADATSNARGKMSTMRGLGIGDGYKKGGQAYRSNAERFLLNYSQFDPGEIQSAVSGISGAGSRRAAYSHGTLNTVLQAYGAGIQGTPELAGTFSRFGGGASANIVDLLRSQAGAGTDVSVTGLLGQYLGGEANRLNTEGFTGSGALGAVGFGTTGDQGAMVARQNIQGMSEIQRLYSGGRDPAQKAMNFMSAMHAAPGAGYYAQRYLATGLDAGRMADIMGGDFQLTPEERNLGVTEEMLKAQAQGMTKSRGMRAIPKGFAKGSPAGDLADAMGRGENIRDITKKMFANEGKWDSSSEQSAIEAYATVLRAGDANLSLSQAMGTARMELFGLGRQAKKGKMVGDVAGASFEAKVAKDEAERRKTDLDLKDASMKALEEQAHTAEVYKRLVTNSSNLAITADNIAVIIKSFSDNLKKIAGGGTPAGSNTRTQPKK